MNRPYQFITKALLLFRRPDLLRHTRRAFTLLQPRDIGFPLIDYFLNRLDDARIMRQRDDPAQLLNSAPNTRNKLATHLGETLFGFFWLPSNRLFPAAGMGRKRTRR